MAGEPGVALVAFVVAGVGSPLQVADVTSSSIVNNGRHRQFARRVDDTRVWRPKDWVDGRGGVVKLYLKIMPLAKIKCHAHRKKLSVSGENERGVERVDKAHNNRSMETFL